MFNVINSEFEAPIEEEVVTVSPNLIAAVRWIDQLFGYDFAKQNPTLIGLIALASAIDRASTTSAMSMRAGLKGVASAINNVKLPDLKEEIRLLADATESVASAIEYK